MAASLRTQKTAMAVTVILPVSARVRVLYGSPAMPLRWKSASATTAMPPVAAPPMAGCTQRGTPVSRRNQARRPSSESVKATETMAASRPSSAYQTSEEDLVERVVALHVKDGVGAQNRVFDNGGQRGGDNDAGEHGLVEVADQFLKGEGDGGNGRVKGSGDARRHAHGSHAAGVLGAESGQAGQHAADARAHLHRRSFKAQRSAGADLEGAQDKLADGFADGDHCRTAERRPPSPGECRCPQRREQSR